MRNKLKSILALNGENFTDLADCLDVTPQAVSKKLNNGFSLKDIKKIQKKYNLTNKEVVEIFIES